MSEGLAKNDPIFFFGQAIGQQSFEWVYQNLFDLGKRDKPPNFLGRVELVTYV
jgi:hypothetical protein